jgi:hypothetical protein
MGPMTPLDKHYLSLQFKIHVYSKSGSEFQAFFERIMEKAFPDYQKIRPYGREGDSGNDGYRKKAGIYYQIYAPYTPKLNEAIAAKKLRNDFEKLLREWDEISNIKEYNFVFNDKYGGSVKPLEEATSTLATEYPNIDFRIFLANDLERVFFELDQDAMLELGFNIDRRQAVDNAQRYLDNVKRALDREDSSLARRMLDDTKDVVSSLNDERLSLEYDLVECRCLQKLEKVTEARQKYQDLSSRFPNDPRPLLYMAEIDLNDGNSKINGELLEKAERIDSDYWLLRLERLIRKISLGEPIDTQQIDDSLFPDDPKIKANFYRLHALPLAAAGEEAKAESYVAEALHLDPERFANHEVELTIIEIKLRSDQESSRRLQLSQTLLSKIEQVESRFAQPGGIGPRNQAILNARKLLALYIQENVVEIEALCKETFELVLTCNFDLPIESIVCAVLQLVAIPNASLNQLLDVMRASNRQISDDLCKALMAQFGMRDALFTSGRQFFQDIHHAAYAELIDDLESRNYARLLPVLEKDVQFALTLAVALKGVPDLRKRIIEALPDQKEIQKEKLLLLLSFDEKDFDEAFEILQHLDLSTLDYLECRPMLLIAQQKKAWDFEITLLEKLLEKEKSDKEVFNLKLHLFEAYRNLGKYIQVINLGEQLLSEDSARHMLDPNNREALLSATALAGLERGKVEDEAFKTASRILEDYPLANPTFEFKVGIEAEVYLSNNEVGKALQSVIDGVKLKKVLSAHEYAKLYFVFFRIGNRSDLNLDSLPEVQPSMFVRLAETEQWYFIVPGNELDASLVAENNDKYPLFMGRKLGDKVVFLGKYSSEKSEHEIEAIYSIEKYVLWKTLHNFQQLSKTGDLEGVQMIEVPHSGEAIDMQNLLRFYEDVNARTGPLFDIYCKNNVPLAVLAMSEGGLTNAVARIQSEGRGFINFSVGTLEEFEAQKVIARQVVHDELPFYIDSTSALTLAETGLLPKIHVHVPNLKVPQSVVNLLAHTADRFGYAVGESGYLGYTKGRLVFSSLEKEKRDRIRSNFVACIRSLEADPKNIGAVALAGKQNCFSERRIPAELSDACILAQREQLPILTEDFLYLQMNEAETKKKAPRYFSSLALFRVLYEEKRVAFAEYLDYFGYLSSYRFRFLSIHSEDLEKAVFGDGTIKTANPENLRKLNFPLTLAEDYGVAFQGAFRVVGRFLLSILIDSAVTLDLAQKIFIEIIDTFPTKMPKEDFGRLLLSVCLQTIEKSKARVFFIPEDDLVRQKVDQLLEVTKLYKLQSKLWTPE